MKLFSKLFLSALAATQVTASDLQQPIIDGLKSASVGGYNIAIVGAGAAGSSAAYHISKFARELELDVPINITIFEADDRIGGRTTTVDALEDPRYPIEVGGSIFVKINEILYNATQEFRLSTNARDSGSTGSAYDLGIWDGESFVFTLSNDDESSRWKGTLGSWWDVAKLFWKYGLSPIRLRNLQQSVIGRFLRLYHEDFPFADLTEAAKEVDLLSVTAKSGRELLEEASVGEKFANEIIQASTRVNYAQNLPDFHGLETMVCMSTDGGMSVEGGNWQIFDRMVKESGAHVNFLSEVTEIDTSEETSQSIVQYTTANNHTATQAFDFVILSAPYNASTLTFTPAATHKPNRAEYVSLHVTLFSSPFRPDPIYFGLSSDQLNLLPDTVLTTLPSYIDADFLGRGAEGVGPTQFWSLSTLRTINPTTDLHLPPFLNQGHIPPENLELHDSDPEWPRRASNGQQYLYKIFSPEPLSAEFMIKLFGWEGHPSLPRSTAGEDTHNSITTLPKDLLSWTHEKHWYSYPYLPPTEEFDCFDIYNCRAVNGTVVLAKRLYYTSAIESFISTMETSALSGRNVARLIVDDLLAKQQI